MVGTDEMQILAPRLYLPELCSLSARLGHNLGCAPLDNNPVAQVCPIDTRSHTIAINREFFELLQISPSKDSQLSTLVHEVTHFRDTFSSVDLRYGLHAARRFTGTPKLSRINADNIAGYVVDGVVYGD
jgi:hypothetical protein